MSKTNIDLDAVIILSTPDQWLEQYIDDYKDCLYPVIVVQPDLKEEKFKFEATTDENLRILHVYANYQSPLQTELIAAALNLQGIIAPLLCIYNSQFIDYIQQAYSPYKIYYATQKDLDLSLAQDPVSVLARLTVLNHVNEIVCCTPEMQQAVLQINYKLKNKITLTPSILSWLRSLDVPFSEANHSLACVNKLNILVLYEKKSCSVSTVKEHLESFSQYSNHRITYSDGTTLYEKLPHLAQYDVVVIHYSLRLSVEYGSWTLSLEARNGLKKYAGLKIAFVQDEYETTNQTTRALRYLGVQCVFTCVPEISVRKVYPAEILPHVKFVGNLTGYVPKNLINYPVLPLAQRTVQIAYRGRNLPFWYGDLGQEKECIGRKMKEICLARGIAADIEWDSEKRIYGQAWYEFLATAKATLGTESGANVFDFDGSLSNNITQYLSENPRASYTEVADLFLKDHEGVVKMNQISPKIFEAICLHTALILFEGEYSGILVPNKHYILLKKDFSNIDDVLEKLNDVNFLTMITHQAYEDIVLSHHYSYQAFVRLFDENVSRMLPNKISVLKRQRVNQGLTTVHQTMTQKMLSPFMMRLEATAASKQLKSMLRAHGWDRILLKIKSKLVM